MRCGHCQEVFDASSSLFDLADGGDFRTATPVTADDVARLSAQEASQEAPNTASDAESASAPAASAGPASTEPTATSAPADFAATHTGAPDFRAESWNPWAPAPDATVDRRIRHNAATIPYQPVTIPRSAQPKLKLEFTDGQPLHLENATARAPDASVDVRPEAGVPPEVAPPAAPHVAPAAAPYVAPHAAPAAAPHVAEPPPHTWRPADAGPDPVREPALEPDDNTMVPPPARDGEPHFRRGAAEPFAAAPLHDEEAFAVVRETRAPNSHRTGWRIVGGLVALLLLVALLAQLAWWQRETVMVYAPRTQMLFAQACAQLGCKVAPPRDIDGLLVEPSDLRQVDGPHKLELKMPLHNRSSVALAYPAVELTLLDEHNNIAVRRVLWPQDYVRPGTPIAAGLPPRATETMIVRLDTGGAIATNFRVQIFYP